MKKIAYNCPNEKTCPLHKHCRAITVPEEIIKPIRVWIICQEIKIKTGGKEKERLVEISAADRAA